MKKITGMGQMIDKEYESLKLICLFWAYNVHASSSEWDKVLRDKWALLDYEQRG